jgi:nucleoside-diphosphate-sugar epimerase
MGRAVAQRLRHQGHAVTTATRSNAAGDHVLCDRKVFDRLRDVVNQVQPDAVLDMVCFDSTDAAGVVRLHDSGALDCVGHYLVVSTFFLYNHMEGRSALTMDVENITDGYTRRKAEAEYCLAWSPSLMSKTTVVRLPYVFSHDDYSGRFQRLCEFAQRGEIIGPEFRVSMVSLSDSAAALAQAIVRPPSGYLDIACSGAMTLQEIGGTVRAAMGQRARVGDESEGRQDASAIYPLTRSLVLDGHERPLSLALASEARIWAGGSGL